MKWKWLFRKIPFIIVLVLLLLTANFDQWKAFIVLSIISSAITIVTMVSNRVRADQISYVIVILLYVPLIIMGYAKLYVSTGIVNCCSCGSCTFQDGLYFSLVTWTTLGYGDCQPHASLKIWAALESMVGYFYMAFLIAFLLNLLKKEQ